MEHMVKTITTGGTQERASPLATEVSKRWISSPSFGSSFGALVRMFYGFLRGAALPPLLRMPVTLQSMARSSAYTPFFPTAFLFFFISAVTSFFVFPAEADSSTVD